MGRSTTLSRTLAAGLAVGALVFAGCGRSHTRLVELGEIRRLAADLQAQFTRAGEAANRAVMAETDQASTAAADEARKATEAVDRNVIALRALLQSQQLTGDASLLDAFAARFADYRAVDDEILPLAVENTNLKAQRLLFGTAREASNTFQRLVGDAATRARPAQRAQAALLADQATIAVLRMQVVLPRHIAEADDAAMGEMEAGLRDLEATARSQVARLAAVASPAAVVEARAALDRFAAVQAEIVSLSRRNSNVRSLSLTLGRKRVVASQCEERLRQLEAAVLSHDFTATR